MIAVRLDAGPTIGAGHVMRCLSISEEAMALGEPVVFVVSDEESASLVCSLGLEVHVLGGNPLSLNKEDGVRFGELCVDRSIESVLVDTYGVTDEFFAGLREASGAMTCVSYMDDCYSFSEGMLEKVRVWNVDAIVNYGIAFSDADYKGRYDDSVRLLIGPEYAPVRQEFVGPEYHVSQRVKRALITSGSTNPNRSLERMVGGLKGSGLDCEVVVVVGRRAEFDESCCRGVPAIIRHDVKDMAAVMAKSDLAITAAGSTIYELCALGVPFLAAPIVDNQLLNARGITKLGLGRSLESVAWSENDVAEQIASFKDPSARLECSIRSRNKVDGLGAKRVASHLVNAAHR